MRGARRRARYAAAKRQSASFASSDGWKLAGPSRNQRRAPLIGGPSDEHGGAEDERDEQERRREVPEAVVVEARAAAIMSDEADERVDAPAA